MNGTRNSKQNGANELHEKHFALATMEVLIRLGFQVDSNVLSDGAPGLSFDFGNFKLEASQGVNRWFRDVITLGGVMTTDRTTAIVHFEMPTEVESFEQGLAFVTHCLDSRAGGTFEPLSTVDWLSAGRRYRHLLPWSKPSAFR
jgi:hypothetical protein